MWGEDAAYYDNGSQTLEDKEPPPSSQLANTLHAGQNASGDETGKTIRQQQSAYQQSHSNAQLALSIPAAEQIYGTWEKGCFDKAKEKANCKKTTW